MLFPWRLQRIANFTWRTNIRQETGYGNVRGQAQMSGVCMDLTESVNSRVRNRARSSRATR